MFAMYFAIGIAPCLPQTPKTNIDITNIDADNIISGTVTNLPPSLMSAACVVVFVHTDIWYIHPYANQGEGKSFARLDANGSWSLPTVQREFAADKVAALVMKTTDECESVPPRIGNLAKLQFIVASKIIDLKTDKPMWYKRL